MKFLIATSFAVFALPYLAAATRPGPHDIGIVVPRDPTPINLHPRPGRTIVDTVKSNQKRGISAAQATTTFDDADQNMPWPQGNNSPSGPNYKFVVSKISHSNPTSEESGDSYGGGDNRRRDIHRYPSHYNRIPKPPRKSMKQKQRGHKYHPRAADAPPSPPSAPGNLPALPSPA
ncbi:hypothetical protein H0H92_010182 [Tricholoma furcatifolium]|nr:hypothetical protein H0H92_010182 [Tricholoma furcatifolium]